MIVSARKPEFFQMSHPLYEVVTGEGLMRPCFKARTGDLCLSLFLTISPMHVLDFQWIKSDIILSVFCIEQSLCSFLLIFYHFLISRRLVLRWKCSDDWEISEYPWRWNIVCWWSYLYWCKSIEGSSTVANSSDLSRIRRRGLNILFSLCLL